MMAALCILAAALAPMQPAWRQAEPQLRVGREPVCMSRIPKAFRGGEEELREGSVWEGRVEEITEFGCFVSMGRHGLQHHRGLLHVSTVSSERLDAGRVPSFMEDHVGPVGSKVRVRVNSLMFKRKKAVALKLLEVLSRVSAAETAARALEPGPRRTERADAE